MDRPAINKLSVFDNIEVRVLGDRETRVVRDDSDARTDRQSVKHRQIRNFDDAMFLR